MSAVTVTRDTFSTEGQWNKFKKLEAIFKRLIKLHNSNHMILFDGEQFGEPFIDGWEMGFKKGNFSILITGNTHGLNPKTGEYDVPWIDVTLKDLRSRIKIAKLIPLTI